MTEGTSPGFRRPIVGVTCLAFLVRALWLLRPATDLGDAPEYLRLASHLVTLHMFSDDGILPSSYRPPLYPALIAAGALLTSHPIATILFLQIVLGTCTVALIYTIAEELFGDTTAMISGGLLALAPMTARFSTVVLTETVFSFLVVIGVWAWIRSKAAPSGLALGLATLTRASSLPYLIALMAYGLLGARSSLRRSALIVSIVGLTTVAPWAIRNVAYFGRITIADAGWGVNLFYGTIDLRRGSNRWSQLVDAHARLLDTDASMPTTQSPTSRDAYQAEKRAHDFALPWIRQHPGEWSLIRLGQWPWLFLDTGDYLPVNANKKSFGNAIRARQVSTIVLKVLFLGGNALLVLLAGYGAVSLRGRLQETLPLWSFPVYVMAAHLPVYVEPRYGLPLVPFLAVFAAEGIRRLSVRVATNPTAQANTL